MTNIDWSRFKSDFVTWTQPGMVVEGTILALGLGSLKGKEYPELKVRTADGDVTVSANQTVLQRLLADDPPVIGDNIRIEYIGEADHAQPGFNPAKLFQVTVTHRQAPGQVASTSDLI